MDLNFSVSTSDELVSAAPSLELVEGVRVPHIKYALECFGPDGKLKWSEDITNLVVTAGKTFWVDTLLKGSAYTAAWYMGLKGTGTALAADTLASHGSWSEITPYAGNRPAITWGTTATGSNTASGVAFTMNAATTIYGAFICTVNTGTAGTLYSVADLGTPRGVGSGDVVTITPTLSGS